MVQNVPLGVVLHPCGSGSGGGPGGGGGKGGGGDSSSLEVVEEGDNNIHFKSLATFLASSSLNQQGLKGGEGDIKGYLMLKTPTKTPTKTPMKTPAKVGGAGVIPPPSPNLEWLHNGNVSPYLNKYMGFINFCG